MSKNSQLQNYRATMEWLESRKRARKFKRKSNKNSTTSTKHRFKSNNRRDV